MLGLSKSGSSNIGMLVQFIVWNDLGHFWLDYIRMLGHLQLSAHLQNWEKLRVLEMLQVFLDIGTMTLESVPHPLLVLAGLTYCRVSAKRGLSVYILIDHLNMLKIKNYASTLVWQSPKGRWWLTHRASMLRWRWSISEWKILSGIVHHKSRLQNMCLAHSWPQQLDLFY